MIGEQLQELVSEGRARISRAKANLPVPRLEVLSRSRGLVDNFPMIANIRHRLAGSGAQPDKDAVTPVPAPRPRKVRGV
ncbi:hypothetical protein ES702_05105 [subsurface metagenome]